MIELATAKQTQLTVDGVEDFGYATNNAGWVKSETPESVMRARSR